MIPGQPVKVVVATKLVDFCKGRNGLVAVVQRQLGLDPHSSAAVAFRSEARRPDQGAVLGWRGDRADIEAVGRGQVCLACDPKRCDARVTSTV